MSAGVYGKIVSTTRCFLQGNVGILKPTVFDGVVSAHMNLEDGAVVCCKWLS